ncbi:Os05g0567000 [Oryza sativa Japonica Group]|uniref:Os05g0567000 protein n=1 Tax=Oryza sativa subsp. japonica TaxID=39947 RepID=A0A0P0WR84_ORYSJ|nr:uncharacterized protein LOC112939007 [Oryza sativa Japonica Group]BAS95380.1 Os05g0567000 [Oryza sativa Japonica Group]
MKRKSSIVARKDAKKVQSWATVTTSLARFREEVAPGFLSLSPSSVSPGDAAAQLAPQTTTITTSNSAAAVGNSTSASGTTAEVSAAGEPMLIDAAAPIAAEPIDAVPLQAVAAHVPRAAVPQRVDDDDAAPPPPAWIRGELLPLLGLRGDLPLHFICRKRVEASDLSAQQSRFLIPQAAASLRLCPLLSAAEREAAKLVEEFLHKKKKSPEPKPREKGEKSPGLAVRVVVYRASPLDVMAMELTRRLSNCHTIIRQKETTRLVDRGVQVKDDVAVWAFRPDPNSALHFVIANTAAQQQQPPPAAAPNALPQ